MGTRFFPHADFAEDQAFGVTILTTHVLHRGFTAGAGVGGFLAPGILALRRRQFSRSAAAAAASAATAATTTTPPPPPPPPPTTIRPTLAPILLRSAGRGALIATGLSGVALYNRMRGREDVEWRDRSWRLLANEGQVLVDDFSVAGAAVGLASGLRSGAVGVGWLGPVARAGLGSVAGTGAYLVYQYGMKPMMAKKG